MREQTQPWEKLEVVSLIKRLPAESTFEDIQYHLYIAEKLRNARKNIEDGRIHSQAEAEDRLDKWIMK